jgi:magnesium-transporting ATPase (P-type)
MGGKYGCYDIGGIEGVRIKYPVVLSGGDPAMIPFSSDIKFNLQIRDMNTAISNPATADDNVYVFLKGAPERVVNRCTTMQMDGNVEVPLDSTRLFAIESANKRFGGLGERVLAFARLKLDTKIYTK